MEKELQRLEQHSKYQIGKHQAMILYMDSGFEIHVHT